MADLIGRAAIVARLDSQGALSNGRTHYVRFEDSAIRSSQPSRRNPAEASTITSNCPSSSLRSRVSTLPRIFSNFQIGPQGPQLSRSGAANSCPPARRAAKSASLLPHQRIAWIFAHRNGRQSQTVRQLRRHIFQAVHGEVDRARQQRFFDLFGEQTLGPDLRQRDIE